MNRVFVSPLKNYIKDFIVQKHALGFPYNDSERIVSNFDRLCAEKFPNETTITKEMGLAWATMKETEGKKSLCTRVSAVRELARYMLREGVDAYVIPMDYGQSPTCRYVPHIFTDYELSKIFEAADNLNISAHDPTCHIVAPIIFRLLYSCGLRPSEGRLIKKENIDLGKGILKIPESKGHKDRVVVIGEDMISLFRKYYCVINNMMPESEYMFPSKRSPVFCHHWVSDTLNKCWDMAGMLSYSGNKPRPYDFRHTFASKVLWGWIREGRDIDACLPYLSAYMGHAHIEHTAYYIHLNPEFFPQISELNTNHLSNLIPEVEL